MNVVPAVGTNTGGSTMKGGTRTRGSDGEDLKEGWRITSKTGLGVLSRWRKHDTARLPLGPEGRVWSAESEGKGSWM